MGNKFFRMRLNNKCSVQKKFVNGVTLTKKWQIKSGDAGDFVKFKDVEVQEVVKQGKEFVPAGSASNEGTPKKPEGGSGHPSGHASTPAQDAEEAKDKESNLTPDFNQMTVEQLKSWLVGNGVANNELRNATKPDLIERAEFILSQKH